MKAQTIAERVAAYGIQAQQLDGNNVLEVYEATKAAVAECRSGQGPVLLELLTYRRTGHSRRDACHYQPKEEREYWFNRDPIDRFAQALVIARRYRAKTTFLRFATVSSSDSTTRLSRPNGR